MAEDFTYTHGATGTEPSTALDFQSGDAIPPEKFDWWWNNVIAAINNHATLIEAIDSNEDGKVDAAVTADESVNVTGTYKGNDIDSDGDGVVDRADVSTETEGFEVRNSDPNSPPDGRAWIRSDL